MSHNDELSLFLQEVADVRPLRSDHIAPGAGNSLPTEAQLARREAATAERLTLDHLSMEAVPMLDPHDIVGFKRDGVQGGSTRSCGSASTSCKAPSTCTTRPSRRREPPWCSSLGSARCGISAAC